MLQPKNAIAFGALVWELLMPATSRIAMAVSLLALASVGHAQLTPVGTLFAPVGDIDHDQPAGDTVVVTVDLDLLATVASGQTLSFGAIDSLPDGVVTRVERRSDNSFSVFGTLLDHPDSRFLLTIDSGVAVGLLQPVTVGHWTELRPFGSGMHVLRPSSPRDGCKTEGRSSSLAPDPDAPQPITNAPYPEDNGLRGACAFPGTHIDILMLYTAAARDEAGGTSEIEAICQNAVDQANQVLANGGLEYIRMDLVQRALTSYQETTNVELDRNRLQNASDGYADEAHPMRTQFGADVVCLVVDDSDTTACGIAYCTPSGSSEGFCVVQRQCIQGFTFIHEVGHLFGCAHNEEDAGDGCPTFCVCSDRCDSFGYRFTGASGNRFRTIMAYPSDSPEPRIGWFSQRSATFDGVALGHDCEYFLGVLVHGGNDNRNTVQGNSLNVEMWRNPRFEVWVDFAYSGGSDGRYSTPWRTATAGVNAAFSGPGPTIQQPTLWIKAGTSAETAVFNKRMTVRPCGGMVRIGG